ncbi:uncharacterized protein LOC124197208 [Daphnia pulex]|uniref:uncharacterized protein LOC124197208 n=1 Tax=Daphnia pulex TaxID=6669 RepID=UPI001EE149FC|nr:uncharacterized protein LOC124197208 [Daphnia pulex]
MPKVPKKISREEMIKNLEKARTKHAKHFSSDFEVPEIVDGNVRAKCLYCKIYLVATGFNLSRHVCLKKKLFPPIKQLQGPNPPETQPTIDEVLEENRQLRAQLEVIPVLQDEIRKLHEIAAVTDQVHLADDVDGLLPLEAKHPPCQAISDSQSEKVP